MNSGIIELDLHGANIHQAEIAVNAALKRSRGVYRIRIIHGYHGGQAIKSMLRNRYSKHPGVLRLEVGLNQGQTDLVLREF